VVEKPVSVPAHVTVVQVADGRRALASLAANACGRPHERLRFLGVTGTNGKTTTAWLVAGVLAARGERVALLGTVGNSICGLREGSSMTTPGPLELHPFLSRAREQGCTYVVMEVSSHALDQQRVHGLSFEAAGFTNLTQDHLDHHGTMAAYAAAKARLFSAHIHGGTAILNGDGAGVELMAQAAQARAVLHCSARNPADISAAVMRSDLAGQEFRLTTPQGTALCTTALVGAHNIENLLVASGLLHATGLHAAEIAEGLGALSGVPGRMERVAVGRGVAAFVDYAHTPDALERVLLLLRSATKGRLHVVFGCGGDRDKAKRPLMGAIAARLADRVWLTSDNPRSEDPMCILQEISAGVPAALREHCQLEADRGSAIRRALRECAPRDTLLVAGKGHETTQSAAGVTTPFDDRAALAQAGQES
jgi:UDP-N-acetylmuramoyl-L-alanyl-D-glutamate--2,6-diaminopimelate ligase